MQYGVTDPYAVRVSLGPSTGPTASWFFARELLVDGPRRPTGPGDVLVLPRCGHRSHSTRIALMNTRWAEQKGVRNSASPAWSIARNARAHSPHRRKHLCLRNT
ncbi:SsgA family sporulation/cell division regulator [Streptomyces sp. CA-251251]|uniref:SsgA family sporulation/cell division regulator n=1 Tax=Streptomyces sp. CA-251251 TaxID=3240063 RepID=UPI003D92BD75